ncbi:hypothetical protein GF324_04590 [bacterium]|nr:hypothetical protein [bacterium]
MKSIRHILLFLGILAAIPALSYAQGQVLSLETIEIKGEAAEPLAIINISRTRPEYDSAYLQRDYTDELIPTEDDLFAPPEDQTSPKKMEELKALLAKERVEDYISAPSESSDD